MIDAKTKGHNDMTKKQFDRLKPATRRVKIAEDVLLTLSRPKTQRFQPTEGDYCNFGNLNGISMDSKIRDALVPKIEKHCLACAMGALFLSHVRLVNHITFKQTGFYPGSSVITHLLAEYFSYQELRTIEAAFEGSVIGDAHVDAYEYAREWTKLIADPTKRLRAICRNIVAHKGNFDITDLPRAQK